MLHFSEEVRHAIDAGAPVVALESTIIAHGMPYPRNVETARAVEKIIRDSGAVPATIAVLGGELCVGLSDSQLEYLGRAEHVLKSSIRDLPYIVSQKLDGATTVAATMRLASLAGIRVFVTGGIGGVHRGAEKSMDISADLTEMGQTDVAVISAGVKSILDIGLTLEYLETLGIPVVTYCSDEFPSFYSRESGFRTPLRLDTAEAIAGLMTAKWKMGIKGSVLIANPVPADQEVPFEIMEQHITAALAAADEQHISGKETTPFLLKYIAGRTGGESLAANIALVKHNARLGAQIALSLAGRK
jgi:pseudouridine-5'-phosphate glycosidase